MPRPTNPDDAAAKLEIMSHYFDDALRRVSYLSELHKGGHGREALTLCLVYIDTFAQWLNYSQNGVGKNFVEALCVHEEFAYFSLIHPEQMIRALSTMKPIWKERARTIRSIFPGPPFELLDRPTFASSLSAAFRTQEIQEIQQEFWRGTIAAVAYFWLRNPSVHNFTTLPSVSFDLTLHQGKEITSLGLATLLPPLKSMIKEARTRSMDTCEWFGDDRLVRD
jgi:hypothetical protein